MADEERKNQFCFGFWAQKCAENSNFKINNKQQNQKKVAQLKSKLSWNKNKNELKIMQ